MAAPAMTAGSNGRSVMGGTVRTGPTPRHLNGKASLPVRLADRWGRQPTAARTRFDRAVSDVLAGFEELIRMGDTERLGHYLSLFDAVLAGQDLPKLDALYTAADADAAEDVAEARFRRNPCKQTAKVLLDAMGREARCNPVAMAWLRKEYDL